VLATTAYTFLVDCRINGGDSGGPFFDLDGRLVGILKSTGPILDDPSQKALWSRNLVMTRGNLWWWGTAATMIRTRLTRMERGEIIEATAAELAELPPVRPAVLGDLIAEDRRTQGKNTLHRFRDAVAGVRRSVVEILDDDELAALGTVVDAAGLIITKASEVPDGPRCRLPDGRVTPAELVGIDPALDLALLRVPAARGLVAVTWAKKAELPAGTLLGAAGTGELPLAVGVVGIPRRDTPGPYPNAPARYQRELAAPPALSGSVQPGAGFRVESAEGSAAAAGIRPGDIIVAIAESPVPDNAEVKRAAGINRYDEANFTFRSLIEGRRAGERLRVRLLRSGRQIELALKLTGVPDPETNFSFISKRASAPPTVITADIPVLPHECGAPAVGVGGTSVGLVIARFGVSGSFIIPGDVIAARLADLKAGKPLPAFPRQ
jgi:S1-C subfamily serine protease